jgi:hypothetical protein
MLQIAATFNVWNSDDLSGTYTFEKGESYEWDRDPLPVRNQIFFNDLLKSAKQCFSMDCCIQDSLSSFIEIYQTRLLMDLYLFHQQREAEDGKTWLVEHLEREELHCTTDRPLEVPLKSDGRRFELNDLLEDQR